MKPFLVVHEDKGFATCLLIKRFQDLIRLQRGGIYLQIQVVGPNIVERKDITGKEVVRTYSSIFCKHKTQK
jgi:hypothetical protein